MTNTKYYTNFLIWKILSREFGQWNLRNSLRYLTTAERLGPVKYANLQIVFFVNVHLLLLAQNSALSPSEKFNSACGKICKVSGPQYEWGQQFRILHNQNLRYSYGPLSIVTTKFTTLLWEDKKYIYNWSVEFKKSGNREWIPGKQTMTMRSGWHGSKAVTDLDLTKVLLQLFDCRFKIVANSATPLAHCSVARTFCYSLISQMYRILYRSHTHSERTGLSIHGWMWRGKSEVRKTEWRGFGNASLAN